MTKATLRKLVIVLLSAAALSGGLGADSAYARGGGGFGGGHMGGGFGGGHVGGGGHMDEGFGRSHLGIGGGFGMAYAGGLGVTGLRGLGQEHVPASAHPGALAGVRMHPGRTGFRFHHRRRFGDFAWGPRCDYGTDYVMADSDCGLPY